MKIFFVAGEKSGDEAGGLLAEEILRCKPERVLVGFGGEKMHKAGVRILENSTSWSQIGLWENLKILPKTLPGFYRVQKKIREEKPDALLLVDFPFFNLKLAQWAKKIRLPVFYYISPVVWGLNKNRARWRRKSRVTPANHPRYRILRETVVRAFLSYPMFLSHYSEAKIPCEYIGSPIMWDTYSKKEKWQKKKSERPILAILPGSRTGEVSHHLPVLFSAVKKISEEFPQWRIITSIACAGLKPIVEQYAKRYGYSREFWEGDIRPLLAQAEFAWIASGTAIHIAMALGIPFVGFYRVNPLLATISRNFFLDLPFWTLINYSEDREICPELIQENFTASNLAEKTVPFLVNEQKRKELSKEITSVAKKFLVPDGLKKVVAYL
ncbi:MAG: lipid-A-disaccharide synthase [bacterium JZ-2024 1]